MKPFRAVQALLSYNPEKKKKVIIGSCFRLWSSNHFLTANHCVIGLESKHLQVMNCLEDGSDLQCISFHQHPKADIAIIKVGGKVPGNFEKFKLTQKTFSYGTPIHCFGMKRCISIRPKNIVYATKDHAFSHNERQKRPT